MAHSIVVADDHTLIAEALAGIIEKFGQFNVLYTVENGEELIKRFEQPVNVPDIVLLDISMPVMDGFETATWLRSNHPHIKVLALSMQDREETLIKIIRCGARGYLRKNIHPSELEDALTALMQKGYYYPDWMTHKVFLSLSADREKDQKDFALNDRELEFLHYATSELTYKQIADKMFCSPRTVEGYRDSLFEKFNLKTRVGLVIYAIKNGIITI